MSCFEDPHGEHFYLHERVIIENMDMNVGITIIVLLILIGGLIFFTYSRVQDRSFFWKLVGFGALGWTAAYIIRLPLIGIFQYFGLLLLGVDLSNSVEILRYSLHPLVLIWGPLLSGPFEEGARYYCFTKNPEALETKPNRKYAPLILGSGWTAAEIILLVIIPIAGAETLSSINMILVIWERIIATLFHITLSYLVIYAVFEVDQKRPSLWIAMILHSLFNFIILIWIWSFRQIAEINPLLYQISMELAFTIFAVLLAFYTWKVHISQKEKMVIEQSNRPSPPAFEDLEPEEQKKQIKIGEL